MFLRNGFSIRDFVKFSVLYKTTVKWNKFCSFQKWDNQTILSNTFCAVYKIILCDYYSVIIKIKSYIKEI